ncbi:hypothetical protein PWG14_07170, partial (plasmid) [Chromobacterium amazonense]
MPGFHRPDISTRHGGGDLACRQRVAGETRVVMPLDGGRHLGVFAVVLGVVHAHDALQLRELADHVGHQVGLGQVGRARGQRGVGAQLAGDGAGNALQPLHALQLGADLVVVHHIGQTRQ